MIAMDDIVFLSDVYNALLDNDRIQDQVSVHLATCHSKAVRKRYWSIFEELRGELSYAGYLGALERYRCEDVHDPRILKMASCLADHPLADRVVPSDGDAVSIERLYPAVHAVLTDHMLWILAAVKVKCGDRATTVSPRQGHYANDPEALAAYPRPTSNSSRSATSPN
jgi:hypothetical protein